MPHLKGVEAVFGECPERLAICAHTASKHVRRIGTWIAPPTPQFRQPSANLKLAFQTTNQARADNVKSVQRRNETSR
jgi:hypothetical protein